jgi:hypothetical protein
MFYNLPVITQNPTLDPSPASRGGKIIEKTGYAGYVAPEYPVFSSLISSSIIKKYGY